MKHRPWNALAVLVTLVVSTAASAGSICGVVRDAYSAAPVDRAGVFVRTVYVWHITWAVNSVTHRWGYRNYETREDSTNNWLFALLTNGEGWHNNHHADPRSARHGHRWIARY